MDQVLPTWLDNKLIEKILRNFENDDSICVVDINSKLASGKGDNFTSEVLRLVVSYTVNEKSKKLVKKKSLIVKVANLTAGMNKEIIEEMAAVNTEIIMMTTTLQEMEKILDDDTKLGGKCLYGQDNPPAIIIEDLTELGFRLADRQAGLDLQHSLLAIKNLAKFHASSVAVVEKDPSCKKKYSNGLFFITNELKEWKKFAVNAMKSLAQVVGSWPDLGPKYQDKLLKISDNIYDLIAEKTIVNENEFNVINHGDFWINNMFFHYDNNNQVDGHIFLDFQIPVYKSPAIDLNYFFHGSLSEDVFINHRDEILQEYLNVLTMTMKKIGCKTLPPSMDVLKKLIRKYEIYSIFAGCICLPIITADKKDAKNMEELTDKDGLVDTVSNPLFLKRITKRLQVWDQMGLLDV
ncbi:uncharacterized protein LOC122847580 [Aphidius gifuensis]|uniref:uncharacterized protein LOC122847580 n=1 Tax=Aphidius gifuensis TaxID=684658 RepID=UPI001CDB7DAD|nr:uncharacterized protein LOC122847580 [Aphidius gifuensis]